MPSAMVLTEDEALELLAFLITAARMQLDEAAEYGPLRMLTAAGRLAEFIAERASPGTARRQHKGPGCDITAALGSSSHRRPPERQSAYDYPRASPTG